MSFSVDERTRPDITDLMRAPVKRQVKEDDESIDVVQDVALSAYTTDPLNLNLSGATGSGKSHVVTRSLMVFPQKDVLMLGGASATFFYHDHGELIDEDGEPLQFRIDEMSEEIAEEKAKGPNRDQALIESRYKELREMKQRARLLIDLTNKILVFLDRPPSELLFRLRPILSHDAWEISFKFTDRKANSGLGTVTAVVRGWPAVIVCVAEDESGLDEYAQLSNRFITHSPKSSKKKVEAANELTSDMKGLPTFALDEMFPKKELEDAREAIRGLTNELKDLKPIRLDISRPCNLVYNPFRKALMRKLTRSDDEAMRYFKSTLAFMNVEVLKHLDDRVLIRIKDTMEVFVVANVDDFEATQKKMVQFANVRLSDSKREFLEKALKPAYEMEEAAHVAASKIGSTLDFKGIPTGDVHLYAKQHGVKCGKNEKQTLQHWLSPLEEADLAISVQNPANMRELLWRPSVSAPGEEQPSLREGQGQFGEGFDPEATKRDLLETLQSSPKHAILQYRGQQVLLEDAIHAIFRGRLTPEIESVSSGSPQPSPNLPQPSLGDNSPTTPTETPKPKTLDELRALNPAMDESTLKLVAQEYGIPYEQKKERSLAGMFEAKTGEGGP